MGCYKLSRMLQLLLLTMAGPLLMLLKRQLRFESGETIHWGGLSAISDLHGKKDGQNLFLMIPFSVKSHVAE